jgi:hypothetical protein
MPAEAPLVVAQAKQMQNLEAKGHLSEVKQILDDQTRLQFSLKANDLQASRCGGSGHR